VPGNLLPHERVKVMDENLARLWSLPVRRLQAANEGQNEAKLLSLILIQGSDVLGKPRLSLRHEIFGVFGEYIFQ
jgi:hypothetical protein